MSCHLQLYNMQFANRHTWEQRLWQWLRTRGEGFEQAVDGDLEENLMVKMMFNIGNLPAKYY